MTFLFVRIAVVLLAANTYADGGVRVPLRSIAVDWCPSSPKGCILPQQNAAATRVQTEGLYVSTDDSPSPAVTGYDVYIAQFSFGNPPQKFNLTLNSDSYFTTLFAKELQQVSVCTNVGARKLFDSSRSTTFHDGKKGFTDVDTLFTDPFCFGGNFGPFGQYLGFNYYKAFSRHVRDDVRFGSPPLAAKGVPFELASDLSTSLSKYWHSDGILGLKFGLGHETGPSTIQEMAAQAGTPVVTFNFERPQLGSILGELTGTMLIGARDTTNCDDNWTYFPSGVDIMQTNSVPVLTSRLGKFFTGSEMTPGIAVLEVRQTAIFVDFTVHPTIMAEVGAEYDNETYTYVVECHARNTLPDLVLTLVNKDMSVKYDYHVSAKDYIGNIVPRKDGKCAVLIQEIESQIGCSRAKCSIGCGCGINWILGTAAARSHCWLYDYTSQTIAVAKAKSP